MQQDLGFHGFSLYSLGPVVVCLLFAILCAHTRVCDRVCGHVCLRVPGHVRAVVVHAHAHGVHIGVRVRGLAKYIFRQTTEFVDSLSTDAYFTLSLKHTRDTQSNTEATINAVSHCHSHKDEGRLCDKG